jgi:hypothetical protein
MKKWMVSAALATVTAIAPVAVAHDKAGAPADGPKGPKVATAEKNKGKHLAESRAKARMVSYEFRGIVTADATAESVTVEFVHGNKHIRRALGDAESFAVKIDAKTKIRIRGANPIGSYVDLKQGDKVRVHIRAKRGTTLADLPAARVIMDRGVAIDWTPPSEEPPVAEPPVTPPPPVEPPTGVIEE